VITGRTQRQSTKRGKGAVQDASMQQKQCSTNVVSVQASDYVRRQRVQFGGSLKDAV